MIVKNWNLSYLCENKEVWESLIEELRIQMEQLKEQLEHFKTVQELEETLKSKIKMDEMIERIYCYPKRMLDLNYNDKKAKKMFEMAISLYQETEKINHLFQEIMMNQKTFVEKFVSKNKYYKRYFDLLFKDFHHQVLNREQYIAYEEKKETLKNIYKAVIYQDLEFGNIKEENGEIIKATPKILERLSKSSDQNLRRYSFETTMEAYQRYSNILFTVYEEKIKTENKLAYLRSFSSKREEQLFEDQLPGDIITNLVSNVRKNLVVEHQFLELKKQMLQVEEYHVYDMQISAYPEFDKKISLDEAEKTMLEITKILGKEYQKRLEEGFKSGWLDLAISEFKRKDSFSCITYSGVPYTMLQYKENIYSLKSLAHETGHMLHTSYAKENAFEYFEYPIFLAEIASKVHETLLYHYLVENSTSKEEKKYFIEQMLNNFCTSLFSQTMLTEFELEVHKKIENGEVMKVTDLNDLYLSLAKTYYGPSFTEDELLKWNWLKIPHFFLYPSYYVWQYAVGILIANKIAGDLIYNKNDMRKYYIEFLKVGNKKSIEETLKLVGIDLQSKAYIEDACNFIEEKIKVLQKL